MCGRASLSKVEKELEERFMASFYSEELERYNPLPSFNIAPTHLHPVITNDDADHFQFFKWGLIPFWAKEASIGSKMINARIETIIEKSAFKNAIERRRCLIPFDGFYEWQKTEHGKVPYRITLRENKVFAVAGIWEKWLSPKKELIHSFSIITQPANKLMAPIHDRMPAILLPEQERQWLDPKLSPTDALQLIKPYPTDAMKAYTVSKRVNKVAENDADLIVEVPYKAPPKQGTLF